MINVDMRHYNYFTYSDADSYGQQQLSEEPKGSIKMAIYVASQSVQQNILYKECSYIGLTPDLEVNDTYVVDYNGQRLKVLYVQPKGRFKQVFLAGM